MNVSDNNMDDLIFYHFDENEEAFFEKAHSMLNSDDPQEILSLATHFKGLGNDLFKEKNFDGACENYEMAIRLCSLLITDVVEDHPFFKNLIFSLNLNLAACSLKRGDFMRAGQICSLVLQVDHQNVKALFRRAIAALELQKPELAFIDLSKAYDIDPSNQEVRNKLLEVKSWLGIPLGEKRKYEKVECEGFEKRGKKNLNLMEGVCDTGSDSSKEFVNPKSAFGELENQTCNQEIITQTESKSEKLLGKDMVWEPSSGSEELETQGIGVSKSGATFHTTNNHIAEPKYRFSNRRQRGSSLLLSPSSYKALSQGKTLSFYNTRQGSLMSIRAIPPTRKTVETQESDSITFDSTSLLSESVCQNEDQVTSEGSGTMELVSSESLGEHMEEQTIFTFQAMPKHRLRPCGTLMLYRNVGKYPTRLRYAKPLRHISYFSHQVYNCRVVVGSKRKIGSALDSSESPPRKKIVPTILRCCSRVEYKIVGLDVGSLVGDVDSCYC